MTSSILSVSQTELAQRRQQLRQRRRVKFLRSAWRILAVGGMAGGLIWLVTSPTWVLRRPEQVTVLGNQLVKADRVRALLPLRYPQSLFKVEPQTLADKLKAKLPLAQDVTVNRQLFPPGLTVRVVERQPVAIALPTATDLQTALANQHQPGSTAPKPGLLDASGRVIPLDNHIALDNARQLPSLRVIGNVEQYQIAWAKLYQEVNRSPVKISEIDWRDPTNLVLKTEVGMVYVGPYGTQFSYQLRVLDRLRKLPNHLDANQLDYIDLRNPAAPAVQMGKL